RWSLSSGSMDSLHRARTSQHSWRKSFSPGRPSNSAVKPTSARHLIRLPHVPRVGRSGLPWDVGPPELRSMVSEIFELLNWPSFAIGIIATGAVTYFLGLRDPF